MKIIIIDGHDGTGKGFLIARLKQRLTHLNKSYYVLETKGFKKKKTATSIKHYIRENKDKDFLIIDRWILSLLVYENINNKKIRLHAISKILKQYKSVLIWCNTRTKAETKHGESVEEWNKVNKIFKIAFNHYPRYKKRIDLSQRKNRHIRAFNLLNDVILNLLFC